MKKLLYHVMLRKKRNTPFNLKSVVLRKIRGYYRTDESQLLLSGFQHWKGRWVRIKNCDYKKVR